MDNSDERILCYRESWIEGEAWETRERMKQ